MKDVTKLIAADFQTYPVWTYSVRDQPSETAVEPVKKLPVKSLDGSLAGCEVVLSSGKKVWGYLGNLDINSPKSIEHLLSLSVFGEDRDIFHLSRYHDFDFPQSGPDTLAEFLKMKKEEVFPIYWDVRHLLVGSPPVACGKILSEPRERLSRSQIIALALE